MDELIAARVCPLGVTEATAAARRISESANENVPAPSWLVSDALVLAGFVLAGDTEPKTWPRTHALDPRLNTSGTPFHPDDSWDVVLPNLFVRCHDCEGASEAGEDCSCGGSGFDWSDTVDARATLRAALAGSLAGDTERLRAALERLETASRLAHIWSAEHEPVAWNACEHADCLADRAALEALAEENR